MLNRTTSVWLAEHLTDRSKERRNSGGTEGSFGGSLPEYDPHTRNSSVFPFLILNGSQSPEKRREGHESEENGVERADE